jgi:hypothetical protein
MTSIIRQFRPRIDPARLAVLADRAAAELANFTPRPIVRTRMPKGNSLRGVISIGKHGQERWHENAQKAALTVRCSRTAIEYAANKHCGFSHGRWWAWADAPSETRQFIAPWAKRLQAREKQAIRGVEREGVLGRSEA